MPADLWPEVLLDIAAMPAADDWQISPPIVWQTLAPQINAESGSGVTGRYKKDVGALEGIGISKAQDTYKTGTGSRTGIAFTVVDGDWEDDWVSTSTGKYGLFMPNGNVGEEWEVLETTAGSSLSHRRVIISRGVVPVNELHVPTNAYAYLELSYGSTLGNYRINMCWGEPISLSYKRPGGTAWKTVAIAKNLGNTESYLENNNRTLHLTIQPDPDRNMLSVEIDGTILRHGSGDAPLPALEQYRFYGKNGWTSIEVYPARYAALNIDKSPLSVGRIVPNLREARIAVNGTGASNSTVAQNTASSVTQDSDNKLTLSVQASKEDAGDSLGSSTPPSISDITVYIPSVWGNVNTWINKIPATYPPVINCHEVQIFDDIARIMYATAKVNINNRYGYYTDQWGQFSGILLAGNGYKFTQRMRGVFGVPPGLVTSRVGGIDVRTVSGTLRDFMCKLENPIGTGVVLDGWCIYSAVRMALELGQISPKFQLAVPYWPYGPASYNCPYPILGRGTGNSPRMRYTPETTAINILQDLVQDAGVIDYFGNNVPFIMGFDSSGQFHFEPYDPRRLPIVQAYSDVPNQNAIDICDISVYNSVENMRTAIAFQGQDAYTNELLYVYKELPWNLPLVGYRFPWVERNSRWASEAYINKLMKSAEYVASLPSQIVHMRVPYDPSVYAGQLILISERYALGRTGVFTIIALENFVGMRNVHGISGEMDCYSLITARAVEQFIPA